MTWTLNECWPKKNLSICLKMLSKYGVRCMWQLWVVSKMFSKQLFKIRTQIFKRGEEDKEIFLSFQGLNVFLWKRILQQNVFRPIKMQKGKNSISKCLLQLTSNFFWKKKKKFFFWLWKKFLTKCLWLNFNYVCCSSIVGSYVPLKSFCAIRRTSADFPTPPPQLNSS